MAPETCFSHLQLYLEQIWRGEHMSESAQKQEWDHAEKHGGRGKLPLTITRSQSTEFQDYLAASHLCWSCWSGSMCCQWRPPSEGDTPLTPSSLFHLGSLTLGSLQCVWHLELPQFSASLWRVRQRSLVTCCYSCHVNTATCFELRWPLDQETPTPPDERAGWQEHWASKVQKGMFLRTCCFYSAVINRWLRLGSSVWQERHKDENMRSYILVKQMGRQEGKIYYNKRTWLVR